MLYVPCFYNFLTFTLYQNVVNQYCTYVNDKGSSIKVILDIRSTRNGLRIKLCDEKERKRKICWTIVWICIPGLNLLFRSKFYRLKGA